MDYEEELEQINIQNAIKCGVKTGLKGILETLTKEKIASFASAYDIKGRSKMKKEELVASLFKCITDAESIESTFLIATSKEWELVETLFVKRSVQNNTIPFGNYAYLMKRGLLYTFYNGDKIYFVIPDEVKKVYRGINKNSFFKVRDRYQVILKYILAMVNLYGAFKPEKLIEIFNNQNDDKLSEDEFIETYYSITNRQQAFDMFNGYIISDYFEYDEMEEFEEFLRNTKDKPYYIPDKNEFLKYADESYFEMTPQLINLKTFILKDMCSDEELVNYLIDDIQLSCSMENSIQKIIYEFERRDINFKDTIQLRKLIALIIEVQNNSRIWSNHGYTPLEMSKLFGKSEIRNINAPIMLKGNKSVHVEKIGRNEPCPCGSGKKYKKCCGKGE